MLRLITCGCVHDKEVEVYVSDAEEYVLVTKQEGMIRDIEYVDYETAKAVMEMLGKEAWEYV
jgi:hypothetical protein